MTKGIVATTHDLENAVLYDQVSRSANPYGIVWKKVLNEIGKDGWNVLGIGSPYDLCRSAGCEVKEEAWFQRALDVIERSDVQVVINDPTSFRVQSLCAEATAYPEEGREGLVAGLQLHYHNILWEIFKGRTEWVDSQGLLTWHGEISKKDSLVHVCSELGVPIPLTTCQSSTLNISYEALHNELSIKHSSLLIKEVNSYGGQGVYGVASEGEYQSLGFLERLVVQEQLPLPANMPYSIRVVTFDEQVLGAVLLLNPHNKLVSNAKQGALLFSLALPGEEPYTSVPENINGHMDAAKETAEWCGINIEKRTLPEDMYFYAQVLGSYPSNCLLRGIDFMCRGREESVVLEVNVHPGPPAEGMFSSITDVPYAGLEGEIDIATRLLTESFLTFLETKCT